MILRLEAFVTEPLGAAYLGIFSSVISLLHIFIEFIINVHRINSFMTVAVII